MLEQQEAGVSNGIDNDKWRQQLGRAPRPELEATDEHKRADASGQHMPQLVRAPRARWRARSWAASEARQRSERAEQQRRR